MNKQDVIDQARWEIELEQFEAQVEIEKERLRAGTWFDRLFPFTIEIKRKTR